MMPVNFRAVRMSALAAFGFLPSISFAQTPPSQPDVVGLQIGMTMDQAEDVLKKYNPDMKIVPLYIRVSSAQDFADHSTPSADVQMGSSFLPSVGLSAKVKVPTELIASTITHFYGDYPIAELSGSSADPVIEVSGEWFRLDFTPTDAGGRLYAIVHTLVNPIGATLPPDTVQGLLVGKYGQPSISYPARVPTDQTIEYWMYDQRGRLLPAGHPDAQRCKLTPKSAINQGDSIDFSKGMYSLSYSDSQGNSIHGSKEQYDEAFSDVLGTSLSRDDYYGAVTALGSVEGFVPDYYQLGGGNPQARQCGIQVYSQFQTAQSNYPAYFIVSLSDQNSAFYDNGVGDYVNKKLSEINGPAVSAPAPNL